MADARRARAAAPRRRASAPARAAARLPASHLADPTSSSRRSRARRRYGASGSGRLRSPGARAWRPHDARAPVRRRRPRGRARPRRRARRAASSASTTRSALLDAPRRRPAHALLHGRGRRARARTRATTSPTSSAGTSTSPTSATSAARFCGFARHKRRGGRLRPPAGGDLSRRRATRSRAARPSSASRAASTRARTTPTTARSHRRAEARVPAAPHPRVLARGDRPRPPARAACRSRTS